MEDGLPPAHKRKYISITDRKEAIKAAIMMAGPEDIVLIAGKGHEKYQEIKGVRNHFDDREIVTELFKILNK
jgi:UDP-N-acetylmuramoyl-L-alanyl-D-glutamate--2,6-diaminopimelate ligase